MSVLTALELLDRLDPEPPIPTRSEVDGMVAAPDVAIATPMVATPVGPEVAYVAAMADLAALATRLADARALGLDLETTGLDPHADAIRLVTVATGGVAYVVDARSCAGWPDALRPLLGDARIVKVAHNAVFDLAFLLKAGVEVRNVHDTMLAAQLIDGGEHLHRRGHFTLAALAERELGRALDKALQVSDWGSEHLSTEQVRYAAHDAAAALDLYGLQVERLAAEGLDGVARLESAAVPALAWLALSGVPFDALRWADLSDAAMARKLGVAAEVEALLGRSINLDSPKQLRAALNELGVMVDGTAEEVLVAVADRHPVVPKILEYRVAGKLARTYGLAFVHHVNTATGRIHASYRQIGAATGRMSCSRPNLQQVPRDPAYRACFRPPGDRVLVKADLALIELCVAAELSGDERMIRALVERQDLHRLTAAALFGKAPDAVTADERAFGKAVNFGTLFGQGRRGLMALARRHGLALSEAEAWQFQRRFSEAWPRLAAWQRTQMAGTDAIVRTASGRIRRLGPDTPGTVRANSPIQGTAADGFKAGLAVLWAMRDRVPSAMPVLAVHDEVVVEVDAGEAEAARAWLVESMTRGMRSVLHTVPVVVEATIAADWSGAPIHDAGGDDGLGS